jgi:gamma-glutamyl-gamma-aminobutyrate hydrolase PuuD
MGTSRVEHPLIAVNGLMVLEPQPRLALDLRYADAILKAGGVPVAVPPCGGPRDIERLLARVDGLLLTGGDDFHAEPLGQGATHAAADPVPRAKQDFDFLLVRAALARKTPVLGICYGMQLLGLAEGARLLQHLPEDRPGSRRHSGNTVHPVLPRPGTKLAGLVGLDPLPAVSRHHQALDQVLPPWRVSAVDDEGLVEAIERDDHPFALGVQWHPELDFEGSRHDRLLRALVGAAGIAAARELLHS